MKRKTPDDGLTFVSIHVFLTDSDGFLFLDGSFLPTARVSIESFCFDVVSFLVLHDFRPKIFLSASPYFVRRVKYQGVSCLFPVMIHSSKVAS